jgi:molybdopterin cofactor biosynthesis protein B
MSPRAFGITGWKNSGKTTLTARLIAELTGRGYRVCAIKHAHESFDIDPAWPGFLPSARGRSPAGVVVFAKALGLDARAWRRSGNAARASPGRDRRF